MTTLTDNILDELALDKLQRDNPLGYSIWCPNCYSDNTQCQDCGNSTGDCECTEIYEVWCHACGSSFDPYVENIPTCLCETRFTTNLRCDDCRVYRESMNDPWQLMSSFDDDATCLCQPQKKYFCSECQVAKNLETDKWEYHSGAKVKTFFKCRHYNVELKFDNGVSVFASSEHRRSSTEDAPDFGVYLDGFWEPSCPAYYIDWPDYSLPTRWGVAAKCIIDAYKKAEAGLWVEIGCIGGHGRTGTVLACMAVLAGMGPKEAVAFVRAEYCNQAIESDEQEWYVEWFSTWVNGGTMRVKTSKILGKTVDPDEEYEFDYGEGNQWRDTDVITASGLRPDPDVSGSSLKKRSIAFPPDPGDNDSEVYTQEDFIAALNEQDDAEQLTVFDYCDECNMTTPCFHFPQGAVSEKFEEQMVTLVERLEEKNRTEEEDPF